MPTEVTDPAILAQLNGGAPAPRGNVFTLPQNPKDAQAQQNEQIRLILAQQAAQQAQAKARRDALEWQATHNPDGSPKLNITQRPTLTAKERADAIQAYNDAFALDRVVASLRQQYDVGPGATKGLYGIQDYFPTAQNQTFDDTAQQARGFVKRSLGFTGGEGNTIAESSALYDPYLPNTSDKDPRILNKIAALEQLAKDARTKSTAILGGIPDANGSVSPVQDSKSPAGNIQTHDPMNGIYAQTQAPTQAAGFGATTKAGSIPPEMQQENANYLLQNAGKLDPQDYAQFYSGLAQKYGFNPPSPESMADFAKRQNDYVNGGGKTFGAIPAPEVPMSTSEIIRNSVASNPAGAAAINFADAGSFGGVTAMAPGQMGALRDKHPIASALGGAAGAIGATKGLGMAGGGTLGRVPALANANPFVRNLATDAAYGGIYGGVTEGDPLTGALIGGGASVLGQGAGKALGTAIGGMARTPAAQFLKSKGISLTVPQQMGGMAKGLEDRLAGYPVIGDMINARRAEGFQDFNRAALNEAGAPIGATTQNLGEQGLNDLYNAAGNAYDSATAGVNVPLDAQFPQDLASIGTKSRMLPPDLNARFSSAMDNAVQPIAIGGSMTGDAYQQAMRGLKGYKAEMTKPGFEADYRGLLSQAQDALKGQMMRGGGQSTVEGLAKADQSYRMAKTLEKAMAAAKNGTGSGELQVFTPAQLNTAAYASANKFPGPRPFADLADNAQQVMPSKVPDSGTAGRIATMALPAILGGSAAGADSMGWDSAGKGLAIASILAAGGTKTGQKGLEKLLLARPDWAKAVGGAVSKKKGLFGSAAIPLLLEASK